MAKVSSITRQVKRQNRYSVFVDDKYSFSLSETQLADSGLHIGQELSAEEIKGYKSESALGKLYERTLNWLAIRPRSEWEIETYLDKILLKHKKPVSRVDPWEQRSHSNKIAKKSQIGRREQNEKGEEEKVDMKSEIVEKLKDLRLVDDLAFARSWVDSRRLLKATSRKKLWVELKTKRVPADIIEQVLDEDETDELEVLKSLIERKSRQSQYRDRQKLLAYLARQGFRYDQIKQALEELELGD